MNAQTTIELVDVTAAMIALNIGKIERYPGGFFTVALMDGSVSPACKSVGEAFEKIQRRSAAS